MSIPTSPLSPSIRRRSGAFPWVAATSAILCLSPGGCFDEAKAPPLDEDSQSSQTEGSPSTSSPSDSTSASTMTLEGSGVVEGGDDTTGTSALTTTGFATSSGGTDACERNNPCDNGGICVSDGAEPSCDCTRTGFTGESCAVDLDECASPEPVCSAYATCTNEEGSFTCECGVFAEGDPFEPAGCCPEQTRFECGEFGAFGPCEPFATSDSELIIDHELGYIWIRHPAPQVFNWSQANATCNARGMRLPSVEELESIVDSLYVPTWMPCVFEAGPSDSYWSSTAVGGNSAFVVHFSSGTTGNTIQQNDNGVRCVQ